MLIYATIAIAILVCIFFLPKFRKFFLVTFFLCLGMTLMGFTYGPLGTFLSELFPTNVRYSGTSGI
jgi:hypothetical protein